MTTIQPADWANLLGSIREPDFQICLNFVEGRQVNLMLSMSRIMTRIGRTGFSSTERVVDGPGWSAQRLALAEPLGVSLDADAFRLTLPQPVLDQVRSDHPEGDGPLLLMAPQGGATDWPEEHWNALPSAIQTRLATLRCDRLPAGLPLIRRAAAVACADVVLTSCPITQILTVFSGTPLVALGAEPGLLPERSDLRCLGTASELTTLPEDRCSKPSATESNDVAAMAKESGEATSPDPDSAVARTLCRHDGRDRGRRSGIPHHGRMGLGDCPGWC